MNKTHNIFLKQVFTAILMFACLSIVITFLFFNNPNREGYIVSESKVTNLRKSSSDILKNLIEENELTFDPTNGVSIKTVFKNLKNSNNKKILLLGSSQLVTLNDDWSFDSYLRRVDKTLERKLKNATVYNLSMGGMTVDEKMIILKKALEVTDFDEVVISIGPYDCRESEVRKTIKEIENYSFEKLDKREITDANGITEETKDISMQGFNKDIENLVKNTLSERSSFLKNKNAIKLWLKDEVTHSEKTMAPKSNKPNGWRTYSQNLNDETGWTEDFKISGTKALKIVKTETAVNTSWKGFKVALKTPTKTIILGGSSKSENVVGSKLYCLDFKIHFEDGTHEWYYKGLKFKQGTNDWENVEQKVEFNKTIVAVTPTLLFYKGTGTVWFDDIYAKPVYENKTGNILLNGDIEEESKIKDVYTLKFSDVVWKEINNNATKIIDFVGKQSTPNIKFSILIPPVYNSELKNGYQQTFEVDKFSDNIKKHCKKNNIKVLDASNLLDEKHFSEFQSGDKKGLVEPLHFDTKGHNKLARYLSNYFN